MKKSPKTFTKVLIANRGEIACRIIRACKTLGLKSVAVYSEADAKQLHVSAADEAVCIGPGSPTDSYLNSKKILDAAKKTGAEAIHPGYGFLSERSHFAEEVQKAGLVWIGPEPKVIDLMGNKVAAKLAAEKAKVPTLPWAILKAGWVEKDLKAAAKKVGFPLLLKAAAGGGGRGMRLVEAEKELVDKAESAMREAKGAFGSSEIFLESFCKVARHIEVQVLGDKHKNVISLGERECSVQRRHQKVIEEAPAPNLSEKTRKALWKAAVQLAKAVNYSNAGTCEFLVDKNEKFYFLEMNTRLQVEHPVTELVWGIDLPVLQLKVAMGEKLPEELFNLTMRGHAIEARIYAEDPSKNFMPSPGVIEHLSFPDFPFIRVDAGYASGSEVPIYYDAMIAKVIAWGMDREQARTNLILGLKNTELRGISWNGFYLADILAHKKFIEGDVSTHFLDNEFSPWKGTVRAPSATVKHVEDTTSAAPLSPWQVFGESGGKIGNVVSTQSYADHSHDIDAQEFASEGPLVAEYPGKVLKVLVKHGQPVDLNQIVVVCESMKMEFSYSAPFKTKVKSIEVKEGQIISAGTVLVHWEGTGEGKLL